METSGPDPAEAVRQYQRAVVGYERKTGRMDRYRELAVDRLLLGGGERVLDVACGTGVNLPLIERRIGRGGALVGVDISREMLAVAAERVSAADWRNVELQQAEIEHAELDGEFDAALFCLTHDVLQSGAAVENVFFHLRRGARVAGFGAKWAPRWAFPVNAFVRRYSKPYVTTFEGFDRPWRLLEERIPDLTVEPVALGGAYIAWGTSGPR